MNGPLKLALVGCGAVAELYHAPALAQAEAAGTVQVVALVDPDPHRRSVLGTSFPSAAAMADLDALPAGLEAAIVASPVRFHATQAIALLERGCAVLCEKPLCRTVAEAEALIHAAARTGRPVLTGLFRRFFPAAEQLRALAQPGGALGAPMRYTAAEGGLFRWPAASASFFTREAAGGGVTMDIGSHQLDLLTWWFGDAVDVAYQDDGYRGVEANAIGNLKHASGVEGNFRLSWDLPTSNDYVIEFERGTVRWSTSRADRLAIKLAGAAYVLDAGLIADRADRPLGQGTPGLGYLAAFTAQIQDLASAASGSAMPRVPLSAGVANLRLIDRLYAARKPWIPAWFTPQEAAAARGEQKVAG